MTTRNGQHRGKKGVPSPRETPKSRFLRALSEGLHVCDAVRRAGVSRSTAYNWRRDDPAFAEAWNDALETMLDNVENAIYTAAMQGNVTAQIFILKTKGKDRGWTERTDINVNQPVNDDWAAAEAQRKRTESFNWDAFHKELDYQKGRAIEQMGVTPGMVNASACIALAENGVHPPLEMICADEETEKLVNERFEEWLPKLPAEKEPPKAQPVTRRAAVSFLA